MVHCKLQTEFFLLGCKGNHTVHIHKIIER